MTTNDSGDERAVETPRSPPRERNIATSTEVERRYYIVGHVSECAVHIQLGIKFLISRWQHLIINAGHYTPAADNAVLRPQWRSSWWVRLVVST
jgi:hypothetical protein